MKKLLPLILIFTCSFCKAQNLVPNWSFEDTVSCPLTADQVERAVYWNSYRESPDYFNYCSSLQMGSTGIPTNLCGYQYPHSGDAYAGFISYDLTGSPYREYIGVPLIQPTIAGQKYYLTFYVSWCGTESFVLANNKLGAALSSIPYSKQNPYPITNNPIAFSDSIYRDSLNWSKVQLSFIADSVYSYLILGNFFDDVHTDTMLLGPYPNCAYYYIDDVCLSTDSVLCSGLTNTVQLNNLDKVPIVKEINVGEKKLIITFNKPYQQKTVSLYSYEGKLIYDATTKLDELEIPTPLSNTMYLIYCTANNSVYTKKFLILK
jgi:hypothetical protein